MSLRVPPLEWLLEWLYRAWFCEEWWGRQTLCWNWRDDQCASGVTRSRMQEF